MTVSLTYRAYLHVHEHADTYPCSCTHDGAHIQINLSEHTFAPTNKYAHGGPRTHLLPRLHLAHAVAVYGC